MSQPKVSIIVPVYNVADYLRACLDSLVGQTLRDIQIICVNDGSTDQSLSILKEYAKKDARISVVDQKNQGTAVVRNVGLGKVVAPYVMWCDGDDYYDPAMCEKMHNTIIEQDVDVVICGMNIIYEIEDALKKDVEEYQRLKFFGKRPIVWQEIIHTDVSLCNKIYKKSIIDAYDIRFAEGLFFEDAFFNDEYMTVSQTIYYLHEKLYNYIRHEKSTMSRSFKKSNISQDYMQIAFRTYDFLKQHDLFEQYRDFFWHRFIQYYAFSFDNSARTSQPAIRKMAKDFIRKHEADLDGTDKKIRRDLMALLSVARPAKARLRKLLKNTYAKLSPTFRNQDKVKKAFESILTQNQQIERSLTAIEQRLDQIDQQL